MIPKPPHDLNHTLETNVSPGQKRVIALQEAVRLAVVSGYFDAESVVDAAEKFHAFLAADEDETAQEGVQ